MKNINKYLSIFAFSICIVQITFAQFTINSGDVLQLNTRAVEATDTTNPNLNFGTLGAGNNWDFTNVTEQEEEDIWAQYPQGLPGSGEFPSATTAFSEDDDSTFIYFKNTTDKIYILGIAAINPDGDTSHQNFDLDIITFPSTLGTTFTDESIPQEFVFPFSFDPDSTGPHPLVDSIGFKSSSELVSIMDASGSLETKYKQFTALRQHLTTFTIDSVFMYYNGGTKSLISPLVSSFFSGLDSVSYDTAHEYRFWGEGYGYPVATVEFDLSSGMVYYFDWMKYYSVGIESLNQSEVNIQAYPVPTSDVLVIKTDELNLSYKIFDMQGKLVESSVNSNGSIATSHLDEGIYQLIFFQQNSMIKSIKIQIQH